METENKAPATQDKPVLETTVADKPVAQESKAEAPVQKQDINAKQVDAKPDESVDFNEFLAVKDAIPAAQKEDKKAEEVKKVDDDKAALETKPKVEEKKVEVKAEEKTPEQKVEDDKASKRDYTDVPEEFLPVMKKAHNAAFDTFKPIVKEFSETKKKLADSEAKIVELKKGSLPDNYYEHSRGYILTPEFENAANTAIQAEQIANHWKSQLERVRKGEPTYQDIVRDPRTGQLTLTKPMQVDKSVEDEIAGYVDWANQQLAEKKFAVNSVAEKHNVTHQAAVSEVTGFEKAAFKIFDGENAKSWEPIVKDTILKTFPPAYRSNPLASGYAKALITIDVLGKQLKALKESGGKVEDKVKTDDGKVIVTEDKKKAGPNNGDMANAGTGVSKGEDITIDDFKAVKELGGYTR
jgi:hypothetical protein